MDLSLFDKLSGSLKSTTNVSPSKKNNSSRSNSTGKSLDELAFEEAIKNEVDSIMANEDQTTNKLISPEAKRFKVEQEVRAAADVTEFKKYTSSAFNIMRVEGLTYLGKSDHEALIKSLDKLNQQLTSLAPKSFTSENLKAALALPAEIKQSILKICIAKYSEGSLEESLAILTFLTAVDEEEPDYWYRLGIVSQASDHLDLALKAFTKTSNLAPNFIGAYCYAAECYLSKGMHACAVSELQNAKKLVEKSETPEDWHDQIFEIEALISKNNSKSTI